MRKRRTHTKVHNSGYSTASLHNSDPNHRRSSGCLLPDIPACPVNTQTNMPLCHTRWIVDTLFKFTMVVFDMTLFESHFRKQSEVDNFQISKRFCSFEQQFQLSFVINYFNKGWTKHCKPVLGEIKTETGLAFKGNHAIKSPDALIKWPSGYDSFRLFFCGLISRLMG